MAKQETAKQKMVIELDPDEVFVRGVLVAETISDGGDHNRKYFTIGMEKGDVWSIENLLAPVLRRIQRLTDKLWE